MQVANLRIKNFRGIRHGHIKLDRHSVIIGANNCGKTTIIEALSLLLGKRGVTKSLSEHDFFQSNPLAHDRIIITSTIIGFNQNLPEYYPNWFNADRSIPKWYDPVNDTIHPEPEEESWQLCAQIGFAARFDREELCVETLRYFVDDENMEDVFDEEIWIPLPSDLLHEIGFFFVPASRTWDKTLSFSSELFRRLVENQEAMPVQAILNERDRLRNPTNAIEQEKSMQNIIHGVNSELKHLFANAPSLKLRLTLTDSQSILDNLIPHFQSRSNNTPLPANRYGTGLLSMQTILLLLQLCELRKEKEQSFCLGIEEPELHISPGQQRRLVNRLRHLCTQTIISTHSPTVAAIHNPENVIILENKNGQLKTSRLLEKPLNNNTPNAIRKLFQTSREQTISALMHTFTLIPEGQLDFEWLKLLLKIVELSGHGETNADENPSFGTLIGVIPTQDSSVIKVYELVNKCHSNTVILVDGDQKGKDYIKQLKKLTTPPKRIIRWQDGIAIEDVIIWILSADPNLTNINFSQGEIKLDELKNLLKTEREINNKGLKGNIIVYEEIADIMFGSENCCNRASKLLSAMKEILLSHNESNLFIKDFELSSENTLVFKSNLE